MIDRLKKVLGRRNRQVLSELIRRDLRARYKVSVLGFFWSLLRPLGSMAVITIVFAYLVPLGDLDLYQLSGGLGYFAFLALGYLPWVFFSNGLNEGTQAILANAQLVKKVYCPRAIFPLTIVGAQLINFLLALVVILPFVWLTTPARISWYLPGILGVVLCQTLLLGGLVMALAGLNVLYRDVAQIMEFVTLAWFYLTPVLYPIQLPVAKLNEWGVPGWLVFLNPNATFTFWYRYTGLGSIDLESPAGQIVAHGVGIGTSIALLISVGCFWAGYAILRKIEVQVVDEL